MFGLVGCLDFLGGGDFFFFGIAFKAMLMPLNIFGLTVCGLALLLKLVYVFVFLGRQRNI